MADFIDLAKPLKLTTPGTAPIAGLVVADTAALEAIESPWSGMIVYVEADGKSYRVTELKDVSVGVFTKKAVKTYEELLPAGFGARPATIALPVPCDLDGENLTLVVDFSLTGEFVEGSGASYARVRMSDSYAKMRVFCNDSWEPVPGPSLGVPYYACTVEFTLDQELFPGYVPGQKYYARYCWIDSAGNPGDWVGFAFSSDVADLVPIRTDDETPLKVCKEIEKSGVIQLDYLDGEVQNFKLTGDANIDLGNVSNVAFGEALIANVRTDGHKLSVSNNGKSYSCADDKVYVVVVTNFGVLNIAVTETV